MFLTSDPLRTLDFQHAPCSICCYIPCVYTYACMYIKFLNFSFELLMHVTVMDWSFPLCFKCVSGSWHTGNQIFGPSVQVIFHTVLLNEIPLFQQLRKWSYHRCFYYYKLCMISQFCQLCFPIHPKCDQC